jgi:phosphate transport system protein
MLETTRGNAGSDFAMDVREALRQMGADVVEMIAASARAMSSQDPAVARSVMVRDADVDWHDVAVMEMCTRRMDGNATRDELRYLATTVRMAGALERIADLAVRMSELSIELGRIAPGPLAPEILQGAEKAQAAVREAVSAREAPGRGSTADGLRFDGRLPPRVTAELIAQVTANPRLVQRVVLVQALAQHVEMLLEAALALAELPGADRTRPAA